MTKKLFFLSFFFYLVHIIPSVAGPGEGDPKERYNRVLHKTANLLTEAHYSPKAYDDKFSKEVVKEFISELDEEKNIFLKTDISSFRMYDKMIDDELKGADLVSFFGIYDVYRKRLEEASAYIQVILDKPFNFSLNESLVLDPDKLEFPADEAARYDTWRKRLKYQVLVKYAELVDDRDKKKDSVNIPFKADSTLEREARDQIRKQMNRYFTNRKNKETMDEGFSMFVNTITAMMDPHTNYFPPVDLRSFNESMSGRFYGIGAQLKDEDGHIKITGIVAGGPAWKQGELKENDEIVKVGQGDEEPVDVTGFVISDAIKLIRGSEKGSVVKLTVKKPDGAIKVIALNRDEIKMEDTFAKSAVINKGDSKIGYIFLPEFYFDYQRIDGARCSVDIARELEKLKEEKVDGVIVDLRGNGGGSLPEVVQMAGLFIEEGPICQVKGRMENSSTWKDRDKSVKYSGPLAVMVDETSASASEIFAAAIQDYDRGIIIGSTSTFGKGTVQRNIPLAGEVYNEMGELMDKNDDMGSVKLTLQKFYRVNGGTTQLKGVTPDVILPDRMEYMKFREKDNPFSLPWDTIKKADYRLWPESSRDPKFLAAAREDVAGNPVFNKIRENVQWLEKYNDREYSLEYGSYVREQKEVKKVFREIDSLYKLKEPLKISNNAADTAAIGEAKDKAEKNSQWLKRVGEDVYIDQAARILGELIKKNNWAKSNN